MQLHDFITIDYYTTALPTSISSFVKRHTKETLEQQFAEAISVKKDLCDIGSIIDDDESKESKETDRKTQPSSRKAKEKDSSDIERLTRMVKALTNENS